jgi:hypothetical protein
MEWTRDFLGWLNVNNLDTFFVRYIKIGSIVSIGIFFAFSLLYILIKSKALISKQNVIDRSLDYDIVEWLTADEKKMLMDDAQNYDRILSNVFRRKEYGRIRKEYESTLSMKKKERLFQQALIIVHQEIAMYQTGGTRGYSVT